MLQEHSSLAASLQTGVSSMIASLNIPGIEKSLLRAVSGAMLDFYVENVAGIDALIREEIAQGEDLPGLCLIPDHDRLVSLDYLDDFSSVEFYRRDLLENMPLCENVRANLLAMGLWAMRQACLKWQADMLPLYSALSSSDVSGLCSHYRYGHKEQWNVETFCQAILSTYCEQFIMLSDSFDTQQAH
jgi:hypothetical protein